MLSGPASGALGQWLEYLGELGYADIRSPRAAPRAAALAAPGAPAASEPVAGPEGTVAGVRAELGDCQRCRLAATRRQIVFGTGDPRARLVFVGEAPGSEEDRRGEPFVGAAGQLLDKMIQAMGMTRAEVYILNVIKCRPPDNRTPEADEVEACSPFLVRQLAAIAPKVIVALGRVAAQRLLDSQDPITRLRGRPGSYQGVPVMPTYHPAYLLRNPDAKRDVWADLQQVMAILSRDV